MRRLALIISNSKYNQQRNQLQFANNNAEKLESLLKTLDFEVPAYNKNDSLAMAEIKKFASEINDGDLVFFYYIGHGLHVNGSNYLIPVNDEKITSDKDVEDFGVKAENILTNLQEKNTSGAIIFILDCARPYYFQGAKAPERRGLGQMNQKPGAFIQFSCDLNQVEKNPLVADYHSLFTKFLQENLAQENTSIVDVLSGIVESVYNATNRDIKPWSSNGLRDGGDIILKKVESEWTLK